MIEAYGSFFLLNRTASLLLLACTMLQPIAGFAGLVGGAGALLARRALGLPEHPVDVLNGLLAGLFVGATFAPAAWPLLLAAGPLALALTWAVADRTNLPVLSAPAWLASILLLAAGRGLLLPYATHSPAALPQNEAEAWLQALGSFYGSPTLIGGLLVLAALATSSRYLVLLTAVAFAVSEGLLALVGVPFGHATRLLAGANAALTALMVGGLFAVPGRASLALAAAGAALASLLSVSLSNLLYVNALPPLGLPFLLSTWLLMGVLSARRGGRWERYWLAVPALPEDTRQRHRQLSARGLDPSSLPLRAPFVGEWDVYQGFDGPHTHAGPWRHALDFLRTANGRSYSNRGERLEDYHCFGAPVCSPCAGTVAAARDDLPDNPPGEVDLEHRFGNHVLIALGNGDCVLLAHLQQGSVAVRPGSPVVPGQPLGRCGNSGRSPQPHLHLHVQTGTELGSPTRPFHLAGVQVGSRYRLDARPSEGERVQVPSPNPALGKALHLPVGRRLRFRCGDQVREVEVRLDLEGRFWLQGDRGARVAFVETPDVLALHSRDSQPDPLLDALTLAVGLTPFAEEAAEWTDVPQGGESSRYTRRWDAERKVWVQRGEHRLGRRTVRTEALLSDADGLVEVRCDGFEAVLESLGLQEDRGVPGWEATVLRLATG